MTETSIEGLAIALGLVGGALAIFSIALLTFYILLIVALWKIFTKAGESGWKSIIPIYNVYILCKITKINFWIYILLIPFAIGLLAGLLFKNDQNTSNLLTGLYSLGLDIYISYRLAKAFKKGIGFTIGLIFLPSIFTLILGFGSSKYVGIK